MNKRTIRVGTRGSKLARWQTSRVVELLQGRHPNVRFEVVEVKTRGDRDRRIPLHRAGGVGLFVKELEYALLDDEIDLAVHSLKDMPSRVPPELSLAAVPERADPRDALISEGGVGLAELLTGSHIGTGSPRRGAQILALRPDLEVVGIRGNVETRLSKIEDPPYDAVVLAAAGLMRLGLDHAITEILPPDTMLPAAGQGALGVELRADDEPIHTLVEPVNHQPSWAAARAERAFMARLGAGCHVPAAAYAIVDEHKLWLRGLVASSGGWSIVRGEGRAPMNDARTLGETVAEDLLDHGAGELLRQALTQSWSAFDNVSPEPLPVVYTGGPLRESGIVYLIGAGPGDPGLITVRGKERLAEADVVLYDRLIGDELLDVVHPQAELVYVGKSAHKHKLSQDEINSLLVEKARDGLKVARLKGGDPFVFGRGGEEAQVLAAAGIRFDIVPGITSPIAVPAYAGIPVTHRDVASNFAVVTGHRRKGGQGAQEGLGLDWTALARMDTLIVLMGVGNLPVIVEQLLAADRDPETPAALIRWGTTPQQETVSGSLRTIRRRAEEAKLRPPAVLVVGNVVGLQEQLRWFETRPLFGLRILVTRPRGKALQTAAKLRELGAQPIIFPTIEIRPPEHWEALDAAVARLSTYDWVIFTSTNGVRFFWQRLKEAGMDARAFAGIRLAAIGPITAHELGRHGLEPDLVPDEYVAEAILNRIRTVDGHRILLPRADIARPLLAKGLRDAGGKVDEVAAYRTVSAALEDAERLKRMLAGGEIDILTFTSSSTVRNFAASLSPLADLPQGTTVACIGPITAQTAEEFGLSVHVSAREHTIEGLLDALVQYVTNKSER